MIVWLASFPRSGNTFFRLVLHRGFGFPNYSIYNFGLTQSELQERDLARMVGESSAGQSLESLRSSNEPCIVKTHELPGPDEYPAIYLIRDGRDALVSYAHFIKSHESPDHRDHRSFDQILRDLIVNKDSFGGWSRNVSAWMARQSQTVFVRFEDLVDRPMEVIRESLLGLGLDACPRRHQAVPDFGKLHSALPQFFRSGKQGGWRSEMSAELEELFWKHHQQAMDAAGYRRK
ncbi:MAG: sulfotransferase domain-containing protein [Acidobacteriota bacterium]